MDRRLRLSAEEPCAHLTGWALRSDSHAARKFHITVHSSAVHVDEITAESSFEEVTSGLIPLLTATLPEVNLLNFATDLILVACVQEESPLQLFLWIIS